MKSIYFLPIVLIVLSLSSGKDSDKSTSKDQPENEAIFRRAVARQLNKKPEEVTPEDYINLKELTIIIFKTAKDAEYYSDIEV